MSIYDSRHQILVSLLIELRQAANLRQQDVSDRIDGTSQQLISDMESGQRRLDLVEVHEYIEAVGGDFLDVMAQYLQRTLAG